jgi:hypothetical protein
VPIELGGCTAPHIVRDGAVEQAYQPGRMLHGVLDEADRGWLAEDQRRGPTVRLGHD